MEHRVFRCCHCKRLRAKRTSDQRYCGDTDCQKARKNTWRRERYASDADYRVNQHDSTKAWLDANGGSAAYHRARRKRGSGQARAPVVRGPATWQQQAIGTKHDDTPACANSDAKTAKSSIYSGTYKLIPLDRANSDAIFVELSMIS